MANEVNPSKVPGSLVLYQGKNWRSFLRTSEDGLNIHLIIERDFPSINRPGCMDTYECAFWPHRDMFNSLAAAESAEVPAYAILEEK